MNDRKTQAFKAQADCIVVRFSAADSDLPAGQQAILRPWISGWIAERPNASLVMACEGSHDRAVREERLQALRETLVAIGVPGERVRYTSDAVDLPEAGVTPGDGVAACVQVVSSQALDGMVMPIRHLLQARQGREVACSSTS